MTPAKKSRRHALGQHFLASSGVLEKIIRVLDPGPDDRILEIGAGRGELTFPLANKAGRVVAIEMDERLAGALKPRVPANVEVVVADVLRLDLRTLAEDGSGRHARAVKVVGNLPYAISSPLLFKLIEERAAFDRGVFLVQREVANRACAKPGSRDYAPVSILLDLYFSAAVRFAVHAGSFVPPPKVESAVISLDKRPHPQYAVADERAFVRFLHDAFRRRRKTLFNNMTAAGRESARVEKIFDELGLERTVRPEQTDPGRFAALFNALHGREKP
jgi:16S rRNA (adenine1518-N6/adenine1519-N6)-dimethyltransferase